MLPSDFSTARTSARSIMHELVAQKIKRMQMRHHRETGNAWSAETENGGEGRGGKLNYQVVSFFGDNRC